MRTIYKDFLGKKLAVGDQVVYMDVHYRRLQKAKIIGFTPKFVKLDNVAWTIRQEPRQLIKIESSKTKKDERKSNKTVSSR